MRFSISGAHIHHEIQVIRNSLLLNVVDNYLLIVNRAAKFGGT